MFFCFVLIICSNSSFEIIDGVVPEPKIFLCIPGSAAVYPNGINTLLAKATFFINGNPVFNNRQRILPRNPPDCIILD